MLTGLAMRRRICNGLILREAVDAHIEEAAYQQTHDGEQEYQEYFHGCLLWTYHRPEVNRQPVLVPGAAAFVIGGTFLLSLRGAKSKAISFLRVDTGSG